MPKTINKTNQQKKYPNHQIILFSNEICVYSILEYAPLEARYATEGQNASGLRLSVLPAFTVAQRGNTETYATRHDTARKPIPAQGETRRHKAWVTKT